MIKKSFLLALIILASASTSVFAFFDQTGMSVSFGGSTPLTFGCQDPDYNFYWDNLGIFGRKTLSSKWYVDFESDIGYLVWRGRSNNSALSLEERMIFLVKIYGPLHLGLGGGFSVLSSRHGHPGLGTDGFYVLITGKIRLSFKAKKREYGFDFIGDHISSPTEDGSAGDDGKNVYKGRFYFTF